MLKYRFMSDLHLEFSRFALPELENENEMVLVLAGDVAPAAHSLSYVDFIKNACSRHRAVIWVMGNHEYYRNFIEDAVDEIKENLNDVDNLYLFESADYIVIDGVAFVCSTLWTDYNNGDPISMNKCRQSLSDHSLIHTRKDASGNEMKQSRFFMPEDAYQIHVQQVTDIFKIDKELSEWGAIRAKVLVTHHGLSRASIADRFKDHVNMNGAFVSELWYKIEASSFDIVHHGHTHNSFNYEIGDKRLIANPRGYCRPVGPGTDTSCENLDFDPEMVIEV